MTQTTDGHPDEPRPTRPVGPATDAEDREGRDLWRDFARATAAPEPLGSCPADDAVAAYVDGRLEADDHERFESHLAGCRACRESVGSLRELLLEIDPLPALPGPAIVRRAQALRGSPPPGVAARLRRVGRWSTAAAAGVLVAICGLQAGNIASAGDAEADEAIRRTLSLGVVNGDDLGDVDAVLGLPLVMETTR